MAKPEHYEHSIQKVSDLIPYVNNSRTHSDEQIRQVASSIHEFGFTSPVLIDEQGGIIAGHGCDNVLDLFGGSGFTLIGCETKNKNAFLMELSEAYIDVIINRWQNFTGKLATHIESGKTYEELKGDRHESL